MFGKLLTILAGILALIGAGVLSYTHLVQTIGPSEVAQVSVAPTTPKKEVTKTTTSTTTQIAQKKVPAKVTVVEPVKNNISPAPKAVVAESTVVAPGPLRAVPQVSNTSSLSVSGVIEFTNIARTQNGGLPALVENATLNRDAQKKIDDMFAKQYFEHVSPIGVGPADLAQAVGYAYVVVGENLALGDFNGDDGVVTAWMNSPGHRANILKPQYEEIGVAVGRGMYEGRMTWLAVQSFGMPLSSCPATDPALKAKIDSNSIAITSLRSQLDIKKAQIDATSTSDPNYNVFVNEFNAIVPNYNNLVEINRRDVSAYNASVQAFNACIASATAH